jgi:predicted DCC family thiol-disulfide oxidoreductase YuxK
MTADDRPVLLFDGMCHLCCWHMGFIVRHDPQRRVRFATMQSPAARALLAARGMAEPDFTTLLVLDREGVFVKSAAVLRLLREVRPPWPSLARLIAVVPPAWCDVVYDLVARHRYRLFGRRSSCLVPSADLAERFID